MGFEYDTRAPHNLQAFLCVVRTSFVWLVGVTQAFVYIMSRARALASEKCLIRTSAEVVNFELIKQKSCMDCRTTLAKRLM